jgi:hypothetical protein
MKKVKSEEKGNNEQKGIEGVSTVWKGLFPNIDYFARIPGNRFIGGKQGYSFCPIVSKSAGTETRTFKNPMRDGRKGV